MADTVYEAERDRIDTGLLDAAGRPIYRHKAPLGFRVKR